MMYVRQKGERAVYAVAFVLFVIYSLVLILPILMIFLSSFKDSLVYNEELFSGTIYKFPEEFYFSNYVTAFSLMKVPVGVREVGLPEMIFHTLWICFASSICVVFAQIAIGYVCARYKSPLTRFFEVITLIMMTMPIYSKSGMFMKMIQWMGLYDNWLLVIVTAFQGFGFTVFIYKGFFDGVSWNYAEAVFIDGGGHFTVFFRIMLPQAASLMFVFFFMNFMSQYGDYATKLLYMPSYVTISLGLYYE